VFGIIVRTRGTVRMYVSWHRLRLVYLFLQWRYLYRIRPSLHVRCRCDHFLQVWYAQVVI